MRADGSSQTQLTDTSAYEDAPAWSPDGRNIAFLRAEGTDLEIYLMNADGSGQTRLTSNLNAGRPVWQPILAPTRKKDCRNGGYAAFGFRSQGQCIASISRKSGTQDQSS